MTIEEAKEAMFKGLEVEFQGAKYTRIAALIFRPKRGELITSAEILDTNNNSVVIALVDKLTLSK